MLSIKWITDVSYYLDRANADYYFRPGEPPGRWWGSGAESLCLSGVVTAEQLKPLCQGFAPDGRALIQNAGVTRGEAKHQQAWDLTFSAPKSLSVLWSQADTPTRSRIQTLHDKAVKSALAYLTDVAIVTRRGKGGTIREPARPIVAIFEHGSNRELEPQLHSHCVLVNVAARNDGTFGTILSKPFYKQKLTAGALYQSELAFLLKTELGLGIQPEKTAFSVTGVPKELVDRYSTRSKQIRERLRRKGGYSAKAAAIATLDTRKGKPELPPPRCVLLARWRQTNRRFGFSTEVAQGLLGTPAANFATPVLHDRIQAAVDELLEAQSYFSEQQVVRLVAKKSLGELVAAKHIVDQVRIFLAEHPDVVALQPFDYEPLFTTRQMLALERELLATLDEGKADASHVVSSSAIKRLLDRRLPISTELAEDDLIRNREQREAVLQLVTRPGSVQVLEGMAGTGKTYTLSVAREAWEQAGYRVTGMALSAAAAANLQKGSGIESSTIAMRLAQLSGGSFARHHKRQFKRFTKGKRTYPYNGSAFQLDNETIVAVDEAAMNGTWRLARLLKHVRKAGAKLILIGDRRQLQPIEAGGPFAAIADRIDKADLQHVVRQRIDPLDPNPTWHRQAGKLIAAGQVAQAIKLFAERGRVSVHEDRDQAIFTVAQDWSEGGIVNPQDHIILAGTKAEVAMLNALCQSARASAGVLGADQVAVGDEKLRIGDLVLFTKISRLYRVNNGDRGVVLGFNRRTHTMAVRILATDQTAFIPYRSYKDVQLGYAMTTHKAQGATVPSVYVLLGGPMQDRHLSYVQSTRACESTRLYVDHYHAGPQLRHLLNQMVKEHPKRLAHDFLPGVDPSETPTTETQLPKLRGKSPLVTALQQRKAAMAAKNRQTVSPAAVEPPKPGPKSTPPQRESTPHQAKEECLAQLPRPQSDQTPASQATPPASPIRDPSQSPVVPIAARKDESTVAEPRPKAVKQSTVRPPAKVPQPAHAPAKTPVENQVDAVPLVSHAKAQPTAVRNLLDLSHVVVTGTTDEKLLGRVVERYGRLPGGIVVEAEAICPVPIKQLAVDPDRPSCIVVNGRLELNTGLDPEEIAIIWAAVFSAGSDANNFGVMTQREVIGIDPDSLVAVTMMHADNALGGRVYGFDAQRKLWEPLPHCRNAFVEEASLSTSPKVTNSLFDNYYQDLHPQIVLVVDGMRFGSTAAGVLAPQSMGVTAAIGVVNSAGVLLTARSGPPLVEASFPIIQETLQSFTEYFAAFARTEPHFARTFAYAELVSLLRAAKANKATITGHEYVQRVLQRRQSIPTPEYGYTLRSQPYRGVAQAAARRLLNVQAPAVDAVRATTIALTYAQKAGDLDLFLECKQVTLRWIEILRQTDFRYTRYHRLEAFLPVLSERINDASHDEVIEANLSVALEAGCPPAEHRSLLRKAIELCGPTASYKRNAPTWCQVAKAKSCLDPRFDPVSELAQVRASDPSTLQPYWTLRGIKVLRHQSRLTHVQPDHVVHATTTLKEQLGGNRLPQPLHHVWDRLCSALTEYETFALLDDIRRFNLSFEEYLAVAGDENSHSAHEVLARLLATRHMHAPESVFSVDLLHRTNPFLDSHELLDYETPDALTSLYSQLRLSIGDYARLTPPPSRLRRFLAPVMPLGDDAWWHHFLLTNAKYPETEVSVTAILLAHELNVRKLTISKLYRAMQDHGTNSPQAALFFCDLQAAQLARTSRAAK